MSLPGPVGPPAGWYPDTTGRPRWWTGTEWGAYAPPPTGPVPGGPAPGGWVPANPAGGRADARSIALLAQISQLFAGWIVPLVIYLTAGKEDPFIRHHSAEALNFSLTYLVAVFASFALFFVSFLFPPLFILLFLWFFVLIIGHVVLLIVASVKAYHGEWWRYPVCIRFVSGAV